MSRPTHYPDAGVLYRCLSRLLDPDTYDIRQLDRYDPAEYGERLDRETREVLAGFRAWLGQTRGGEGLTAEREADWRARQELGVRVTVDRHGAVAIRVPRTARERAKE